MIPEALAIAIQHHQAGRLQAAEQIYRGILAAEPHHAQAWHLLGFIAHQTGRHEVAVEHLLRAIALNGNEAAFHNTLGGAYYALRRVSEAAACYRRALELQPDYAEAHYNLGAALKAQGMLDEAVACYHRALQLKPNFVEAQSNLGFAFKEQGRFDEAVACYRRALELKPDSAEAHNILAAGLEDQGNPDEAVASYRRALELKPDYAEALNSLGNVLQDQGKMDQAIACYRRVVQLELGLSPDDPSERHDVNPRAVQTRPPYAEIPNGLGNAIFQLATILRNRFPEDDLLVIRQLLSNPNLRGDGLAALEFGLAQVLDARGEYSEAAVHLHEANALRLAVLKRQKKDFNPGQYRDFVNDLISSFTPELFARTSGFSLETEQPVFIVGLPRSGTTLVEQILASHSLVFGAGELRYCEETFQSLPKAVHRNETPFVCLRDLDRQTARDLAEQHLERLRALDTRALRIVDKMPENYQQLGLIRVLFPQARIIHCRRDLRDVALSCWMTHFTTVPWASDPDDIVFYFEQYLRLMGHWQTVLPSPPLDVDYEELVEATPRVARRIVEWCGLEWEAGCLNFYETQRVVRTASAAQVRRPIYKSSVARWKNYEQPLADLFSRVHQLDQSRLELQLTTERTG